MSNLNPKSNLENKTIRNSMLDRLGTTPSLTYSSTRAYTIDNLTWARQKQKEMLIYGSP